MKRTAVLCTVLAFVTLGLVSACTHERIEKETAVVNPAPTVVSPPPAVIVQQPRVWVPGQWIPQGPDMVWRPGHWE